MLRSRWLYVFLAVVLMTVAGLTYRAAAATNALADHSYDTVEAARLNRSVAADHSYDAVEAVRVDRAGPMDDVVSRLTRRLYLEQIENKPARN